MTILLSLELVSRYFLYLVFIDALTNYTKTNQHNTANIYYFTVSLGQEQLLNATGLQVCHEFAVKTSARSLEGLTGAGGFTFKMVPSPGHWQEASVPCHMVSP